MRTLDKANVVTVIEIFKSLGLMPDTLGKDDRNIWLFTRIIQKYWLRILHTFLGKKKLNLHMEKKTNWRKDALHVAFLKQSCLVHSFLKLSRKSFSYMLCFLCCFHGATGVRLSWKAFTLTNRTPCSLRRKTEKNIAACSWFEIGPFLNLMQPQKRWLTSACWRDGKAHHERHYLD